MVDAPTITSVLVFLHLVWTILNTPWVIVWILGRAVRHRQPRANHPEEGLPELEAFPATSQMLTTMKDCGEPERMSHSTAIGNREVTHV